MADDHQFFRQRILKTWRGIVGAESAWQFASATLPIALAILGVAVTLWPPIDNGGKLLWLLHEHGRGIFQPYAPRGNRTPPSYRWRVPSPLA